MNEFDRLFGSGCWLHLYDADGMKAGAARATAQNLGRGTVRLLFSAALPETDADVRTVAYAVLQFADGSYNPDAKIAIGVAEGALRIDGDSAVLGGGRALRIRPAVLQLGAARASAFDNLMKKLVPKVSMTGIVLRASLPALCPNCESADSFTVTEQTEKYRTCVCGACGHTEYVK